MGFGLGYAHRIVAGYYGKITPELWIELNDSLKGDVIFLRDTKERVAGLSRDKTPVGLRCSSTCKRQVLTSGSLVTNKEFTFWVNKIGIFVDLRIDFLKTFKRQTLSL